MAAKDQETAERLLDEGLECLEAGDHEGALEIAAELDEGRSSGGFWLRARVRAKDGDLVTAIATLESGLEQHPKAWFGWEFLGICRSDADDHEGAAAAFERALAIEGCWRESIRLNQAILALGREDYERVFECLGEAEDEDLVDRVDSVRLSAWTDLADWEPAGALAREILRRTPPAADFLRARAHLAAGLVAKDAGASPEEVRESLVAAYRSDPSNLDVHWHLRELDDRWSEGARYFCIVIHGRSSDASPGEKTERGFWAGYHVVADTPEEALEIIEALEGQSEFGLEIDEIENEDPAPDQPKGLYWRSNWVHYRAAES